MTTAFVAILMGSDSDLPVMEASFEILKKFDIPFEVKVTSAHRTPAATHSYVTDADARGCAAFICAAGMAAHLAGAVSATTLKPVIGVPINGSLHCFQRFKCPVAFPLPQLQSVKLAQKMPLIWPLKSLVLPMPQCIKSWFKSVLITRQLLLPKMQPCRKD